MLTIAQPIDPLACVNRRTAYRRADQILAILAGHDVLCAEFGIAACCPRCDCAGEPDPWAAPLACDIFGGMLPALDAGEVLPCS